MKYTEKEAGQLRSILEQVLEGNEDAIGRYIYKDFKIEIKRLQPKSGAERTAALYQRRRNAGLCTYCGEKVHIINDRTGKLYRLCEQHRHEIDKERYKKRKEQKDKS